MKCPKCQSEVTAYAKYCSDCGYGLREVDGILSEKATSSDSADEKVSEESNAPDGNQVQDLIQPPTGLKRTLSTEFVARQSEVSRLGNLDSLIESRTYNTGEIIIYKGEKNRDLFFLTEGTVEISTKDEKGDFILNEIEPPYIIGDIGFIFGLPRTATAKAITEVKIFALKYEVLKNELPEFPNWLYPILNSFVNGIRSLHDKIRKLEKNIG